MGTRVVVERLLQHKAQNWDSKATQKLMMQMLQGIFSLSPSAPQILEFPEDTRIEEGEGVMFRVEVIGVPHPKLTWYHDGEEMMADYSRELSEDGSLTMPSAETKHSGVYQLVAHNPAGRVERQLILRVKKEQEDSQSASQGSPGSGVPVGLFGNFVEKWHLNRNQVFKDHYKVSKIFSLCEWLQMECSCRVCTLEMKSQQLLPSAQITSQRTAFSTSVSVSDKHKHTKQKYFSFIL